MLSETLRSGVPQHIPTDASPLIHGTAARGGRAWRVLSVLFVVLLAFAATLFFGGDLGRWNDDYFFLRQFERTAPAGDLSAPMPVGSWVLDARMHFWRPLYRYVYTPVVVGLYAYPRVMHILAAGFHMGVSLVLWGLLRRLGAGRTAAAVGGLAFLVYPAHFEGAFWVACTATTVATGLMLGAFWMQVRWVGHVDGCTDARIGRPALWAVGAGALAFAAMALNEQPAFLVAAMPITIVCVRAGRPTVVGQSLRIRWWRVLWPSVLAGVAVGVYVLISSALYPRRVKSSTGGVVAGGELLERAREFGLEVVHRQMLTDFAAGAWSQGWRAIADSPVFSAVLGGAVICAGIGWVWRGRTVDAGDAAGNESRGRRGAALVLLGSAVFVAGWAPLVVIHYPASPRLAYAPSVGLAIALAGVLEYVFVIMRQRPAAHVVVRGLAVPALLVGAVMMIGIQSAYRARWRADERQGEALRGLVPAPGVKTRPVFVPVRVADRPVNTGARAFDAYFMPPLGSEWAAGWWLQRHYRREDVFCVQARGRETPLAGWGDAGSVLSDFKLAPPAKPRVRRFKLAQMVPFEVGEDGAVIVYTHVRRIGAPGESLPVPLPHVAQAIQQGQVPMRVLEMPRSVGADARSGDALAEE